MFFLLLILIIAFAIYMFISDGYIYIASNHFEKEINFKKMKTFVPKNTCKTCGVNIQEGQKYCESCKQKQLINYTSSNELGNFKK